MTIKEVSEKYGISQDTLRYYERVNVIPKVTRTSGGIRDYQEEDLRWVELAVCMRNAGLPIESLIEYQRLFRAGDSTIPARLELLNEQMDILQKQKEQIEETMDRLSYKISRYEEAMKTGKRPEILNLPQDIDQYDEIYLGYPNYWGTMPMAVYTFLESYDFTGKKIRRPVDEDDFREKP